MKPENFDLTMTMSELKGLGWRHSLERWVCDRIDERFPGYEVTEFDWMPFIKSNWYLGHPAQLVISITINQFHELDRSPLYPNGRTGKRGE